MLIREGIEGCVTAATRTTDGTKAQSGGVELEWRGEGGGLGYVARLLSRELNIDRETRRSKESFVCLSVSQSVSYPEIVMTLSGCSGVVA